MGLREDVLNVARSRIGDYERPFGSNRTLYSEWYGLIGPWCAMFASWCFYQVGFPLVISTGKGFAYCPSGLEWFRGQNRLVSVGSAEPGDLVFFDFPGPPYRTSHVAIVEANLGGGWLQTIEGNTNAAGSRTGGNVMRKNRLSSVVGVGRPAWPAAPAVPVGRLPVAKRIPNALDPISVPFKENHFWTAAKDGGVFCSHAEDFYGSMGGQKMNAPIVDLVPTPFGKGYWLVGADGGIFAFGDARNANKKPYEPLFAEYHRGERAITGGYSGIKQGLKGSAVLSPANWYLVLVADTIPMTTYRI